jgi:hypothetical protein
MCGCLVETIAGLHALRHPALRHPSLTKPKPLPAHNTKLSQHSPPHHHTQTPTLPLSNKHPPHIYSPCTELTACASRAPLRRRRSRTPLHHPHPQRPAASLAGATLVSIVPSSLLPPPPSCSPKSDFLSPRPHIPCKGRRRLWTRPCQEAVVSRQDGEERDAQHGARQQGENGGCCKSAIIDIT